MIETMKAKTLCKGEFAEFYRTKPMGRFNSYHEERSIWVCKKEQVCPDKLPMDGAQYCRGSPCLKK